MAGRSPISGGKLAVTLTAILAATAVLPPVAAWTLNRTRVVQTRDRVEQALERMRSRSDGARNIGADVRIVCGPGRMPDRQPSDLSARLGVSSPAHAAWLDRARIGPEFFESGMPTDAWGRCFLLNPEGWSLNSPVWLLSAGPNGLIETPPNAIALGGDDIGGRLR